MWGSGGYQCPRCSKRVYCAEEVIAIGKHWHKTCFRCANDECAKRLDSSSCTDHDGDAYCQHCYKRLFGPKGYGFGIGAGTLSMDKADSDNSCAPLMDTNRQITVCPAVGSTAIGRFSPSAPNICPRCGKVVYDAEKMMGGGSAWHKQTCFTCAKCNHHLESLTLCERDGDLLCKTCYARDFGPKGYGFGIGAGTLQME